MSFVVKIHMKHKKHTILKRKEDKFMTKTSIKRTPTTTKLRTSILALVFAFTIIFSSMPVQAAEANPTAGATVSSHSNMGKTIANSTASNIITPLAGSGYAAGYTNSSAGSFTVATSGSYTATSSISLKSWDFGSSSIIIYISLQRPDGSYAITNYKLTGNVYAQDISFLNAPAGTYTVHYTVLGTYKGWIACWINR